MLLRDIFDCLHRLDDLFQDLKKWHIVNLSDNTLRNALVGNDLFCLITGMSTLPMNCASGAYPVFNPV